MTKIGQHIRDRFAAFVPEGYSIDDLRIATSVAQVQVIDELDPAAQIAMKDVAKEAGPPLVNSQGKPTLLKIVSWVGHAGIPNRNRDAFVKEELHELAGSLFRAPNFGVMDFNHSAVRPWSDDPKVIGVWYKAEWAFDGKADGGKGAWGILATGIAFSWLFPEVADKLLADQARSGTIKVSWTWIPGSVEVASDDQGQFSLNHNPVFFTVSVLDVKPADPDAVGRGSEDPSVLEDDLKTQVAVAERLTKYAMTGGTTIRTSGFWSPTAVASTGGTMNEEMIKKLQAEKATAEQKAVELSTQYSKREADLEAQIATITAARDTAVAALATARAENEARVAELTAARDSAVVELEKTQGELETKVSDIATARDYLKGELDKVIARVAELEAKNKELSDQAATVKAAEADVQKRTAENARKARMAARIASLPESFRTLHAAKPDEVRGRVEGKWADMTDEQWEQYRNDELLGYVTTKVGFVLRSASEGFLPTNGGEDDNDISKRVKRLLKN